MIRRTLLFACAALLTVGLGIGCTTAIFSLLNEPQSSPPDSFFRILKGDRGEGAVATFPQYMGFRDLARSPRELAAWSAIPLNAPLGSDDASKLRGTLVSCNFFKVFGAETPLAGGLLRAEDCYSAHTVAVISERLWRDRFSAHPDIGGENLVYGGHPITIIGVAPGFSTGQRQKDASDVWFPYTLQPYLNDTLTSEKDKDLLRQDQIPWLHVAGHLRSGYSRETATAEFRSLGSDGSVVLTNGSEDNTVAVSMSTALAVALALPLLVFLMAWLSAVASVLR